MQSQQALLHPTTRAYDQELASCGVVVRFPFPVSRCRGCAGACQEGQINSTTAPNGPLGDPFADGLIVGSTAWRSITAFRRRQGRSEEPTGPSPRHVLGHPVHSYRERMEPLPYTRARHHHNNGVGLPVCHVSTRSAADEPRNMIAVDFAYSLGSFSSCCFVVAPKYTFRLRSSRQGQISGLQGWSGT